MKGSSGVKIVKQLSLAQRYPNVPPRLMSLEILQQEGKAILTQGRTLPGGHYGTLVEIFTIDGNGVHEQHLIPATQLKT